MALMPFFYAVSFFVVGRTSYIKRLIRLLLQAIVSTTITVASRRVRTGLSVLGDLCSFRCRLEAGRAFPGREFQDDDLVVGPESANGHALHAAAVHIHVR